MNDVSSVTLHRASSGFSISSWLIGDLPLMVRGSRDKQTARRWYLHAITPQATEWLCEQGLDHQPFDTRMDAVRVVLAVMADAPIEPLAPAIPGARSFLGDAWRSDDGRWRLTEKESAVVGGQLRWWTLTALTDEAEELLGGKSKLLHAPSWLMAIRTVSMNVAQMQERVTRETP